MKIRLINLLLVGSIVSSVTLSSCKPTPENPDYSQDNGAFKDARDSKEYKWVKIGNQIWMAENLTYTGSGIQQITDSNEWGNNLDDDGWCYYKNNSHYAETYGVLYQREAAKSACPGGWHLPNDAEWTKLEQFIENDGRSGNEGSVLKALIGWNNGGGGTDDYDFSALPGGVRSYNGSFYDLGTRGEWWSATEQSGGYRHSRLLEYDNAAVTRNISSKSYGFSVRCVRD